jgi:hypothetical protein
MSLEMTVCAESRFALGKGVRARSWPASFLTIAIAISASALLAVGCSGGLPHDGGGDAGVEAGVAPPTKPPPTGDPDAPAITGPMRLSESGLFSDIASRTLAPGVEAFAPSHPLWADGAKKDRFVLLPPGTKIDTSDMDDWVFPVGTKLWKTFTVDGKLVETRLLWKRDEAGRINGWWKAAYVWEADGSDAIAKPDGVPAVLGTTHDVPSQDDCVYCHSNVRDAVIGFSAMELSGAGALLSFGAKGFFSNPPAAELAVPGTGNVREALGYMHGNCGFCHKKDGLLQNQSAMRLRLLTTDLTPEQTGAYTTPIHLKMRHVMAADIDEGVVPGQPEKSQLYMRMITPSVRMPPKATKVVDTAGSGLVRDWILGLPEPVHP